MESLKITYKGVDLILEKLPNGKYKRPDISQFTTLGLGCTQLDDCRIPIVKGIDNSQIRTMNRSKKRGADGWGMNKNNSDKPNVIDIKGRFPANLLCEDDILNDEYSRFFSLDAWWEKRFKELPKEVQKVLPFLIVPKASQKEKNEGLENIKAEYMDKGRKVGSKGGTNPRNGGAEKPRKNFHPTVKPLKLISYLITLGSREDDIILDPFVGSGTTALAAQMLNRKYIGIELDKEYYEIAKMRLNKLQNGLSDWVNNNDK